MVRFDSCRFYFPSRIVLLGLALLLGSTFTGCSQNSTSDFIKQQQAQEKAVAALTDLGAKVKKADTGLAQGWAIDLSQVPFTPEIAGQLKLLGNSMSVLNLSKTSIDDNQLADLIDQKALGTVAKLDLSHNLAITDQALDKVASLFNLRDLNLVGTQVTEGGITRLQAQRKPKQLVSDDVIEKLPKRIQQPALEVSKRELKIHH